MNSIILAAALTLNTLPFEVIESFYWDCDTMFMKGELGGDDMYTCLAITDEFKKHFSDKQKFLDYWKDSKFEQWNKRGYLHNN
jgi:hypothetical protein